MLCGPPILLFIGHRVSFPGVKQPEVNLTTRLHLVPRLRMSGALPQLPQCTSIAWKGIKFNSPDRLWVPQAFPRRMQ